MIYDILNIHIRMDQNLICKLKILLLYINYKMSSLEDIQATKTAINDFEK